MADKKKTTPNRWLYWLAAIYLLFFVFVFQGKDLYFPIRMAGFFLLAQLLVQVIFPQFRCSKNANLNVASIIIVGVIILSLE